MSETATVTVSHASIQEWLAMKLDVQGLREHLLAHGHDEAIIDAHVKEFKRVKHNKRLVSGFICLFVGAFLGFVSCVLTIINPVPAIYNLILYGLTSIAILIICAGLYFVFE